VLKELQDEGKVHKIGISNCYNVKVLQALIADGGGRMVDVVQNRWHEGNGWDSAIVEFCVNHGIYYQSFWTLSGSPSLLESSAVQASAKEKGCTPAQVVFRFAQAIGITPLSGSTNEQRMHDGVEAEKIILREDDVAAVKHAMSDLSSSQTRRFV